MFYIINRQFLTPIWLFAMGGYLPTVVLWRYSYASASVSTLFSITTRLTIDWAYLVLPIRRWIGIVIFRQRDSLFPSPYEINFLKLIFTILRGEWLQSWGGWLSRCRLTGLLGVSPLVSRRSMGLLQFLARCPILSNLKNFKIITSLKG